MSRPLIQRRLTDVIIFESQLSGCFFIPKIFLRKKDRNFGFSISTTFISYLLHSDHASKITVTNDIISTHLQGSIVARKSPNPNARASEICCR